MSISLYNLIYFINYFDSEYFNVLCICSSSPKYRCSLSFLLFHNSYLPNHCFQRCVSFISFHVQISIHFFPHLFQFSEIKYIFTFTDLVNWIYFHIIFSLIGLRKKVKMYRGKAVPLQVWSGPEGSRKLRFPDFISTAQDGGKFSLTHRPP
jgi:hypothetical protein